MGSYHGQDRCRKDGEGYGALGKQHEILRTAFFNHDGKQMQHILETTVLHLEHQEIHSAEEVESVAMSLQENYIYDVERGETLRLILLAGPHGEYYLVSSLHPLAVDSTLIQIILKWLSFHYKYPNTQQPVKQFADALQQQHEAYATGRLEADWQYWQQEWGPRG